MERISAVYQIKNKITGDRYVGSSKDVYRRWRQHKCQSAWKAEPNKKLYKDFQKYGLENFMFAILAPVEPEYLKQVEQEFIDMLNPAYNNINANGWDVERKKARNKAFQQSEKSKAYQKVYKQTEKYKASQRTYNQTEKAKACRKAYLNQLCNYKGEILTLAALSSRFTYYGILHPTIEAKKYLIPPTN